MTYRIRDWNNIFENNRTRELKRLEWVPVPNKMDGSGYRELVDHENGAGHLGAWYAILEISSRQKVRGTIPQESAAERGDIPQDLAATCRCLSRISGLPSKVFSEVIPRLVQIGWVEEIETVRNLRDRTIPQDDAGKCLSRAREQNGMELNGTAAVTAPPPLQTQTEWPLTTAAIIPHDPAVSTIRVLEIVQATYQGLISAGDMEEFDDEDLARAVKESYSSYTGKNKHGTGLLKMRVPQIILNWGKNGTTKQA